MSLQPQPLGPVPAETARVARAAFPKGSLCLRIADALGTLYQDADFADLFPACGQPAAAPARVALATVLQFVEGLIDRARAALAGEIGADGRQLLGAVDAANRPDLARLPEVATLRDSWAQQYVEEGRRHQVRRLCWR